MKALRVSINNGPAITAGVPHDGVVHAILGITTGPSSGKQRKRDDLSLRLSGLNGLTHEHYNWLGRALRVGDEILVTVVDVERADRPAEIHKDDPDLLIRAKKRSLQALKKELGEK